MISTKDLSGLPNAERLKNFCKGLAALVTAISGKECLFAFSPCGVVCIVADEAPFLLHHDDVQSRQPFAEVFQALHIG